MCPFTVIFVNLFVHSGKQFVSVCVGAVSDLSIDAISGSHVLGFAGL